MGGAAELARENVDDVRRILHARRRGEKQAPHDAVDGGVGAGSEREAEEENRSGPRSPCGGAQRVAEVRPIDARFMRSSRCLT